MLWDEWKNNWKGARCCKKLHWNDDKAIKTHLNKCTQNFFKYLFHCCSSFRILQVTIMSYPFHASSAASSSKKDPNDLLKNLQVPPDKLVPPSMLRPPSPSVSSDDSDVSLRPQVNFRTKTNTHIRVDDLVSAYFPISYDGFVRNKEINGIVKKKIGQSKFEVSFGCQPRGVAQLVHMELMTLSGPL